MKLEFNPQIFDPSSRDRQKNLLTHASTDRPSIWKESGRCVRMRTDGSNWRVDDLSNHSSRWRTEGREKDNNERWWWSGSCIPRMVFQFQVIIGSWSCNLYWAFPGWNVASITEGREDLQVNPDAVPIKECVTGCYLEIYTGWWLVCSLSSHRYHRFRKFQYSHKCDINIVYVDINIILITRLVVVVITEMA